MIAACDSAEPDTIIFNIPTSDPGYDAGMGVWKIQPIIALPEIRADGTVINGTTQAVFIGGDPNPLGPEIVVDGLQAGEAIGFYVHGSNNEIRGIVIQCFSADLIGILGDSNKVTGCYLGPDATGDNRFNNYHSGIKITGSCNIIGGSSEADRNVVSGNQLNGIFISGFSTYNHILGNYIGINGSGTDTLGNSFGIRIAKSNHNIIGPGNVISGNINDGLTLQQNSDSNSVIGNIIGTNPNGTIAWGNGNDGIFITDEASHNIIGGSTPEERNIISGNGSVGLVIRMEGTNYNCVKGNYIGTDVTGNRALPNAVRGISIIRNAKYNIIGDETIEDRNVISGNIWEGIFINGEGTDENVIQNNYIGTNADGAPLPNGETGIRIENYSDNNIIGPGNVIAYNSGDGILVYSNAIGNTITQNSIHSNEGKGISTISGGNIELPPPVITDIGSVVGTAPPNSTIEIFSTLDDEGKIYEGATTADGSGNFNWTGTPAGPFVTATATDSEGNTSEFSEPRISGAIIVTSTADAGEGSLRQAIYEANINPGSDLILFDIPTSDAGFNGTIWVIKPLTNLPKFQDDGIIIDGFSQTANQGDTNPNGPEIVVDGSDNTEGFRVGFRVHSAHNVISGLVISGFSTMGMEIYFEEGHHNRITGNYIGLTASGNDTLGNYRGISIGGGAKHNIIGGIQSHERNVISGNFYHGISMIADSNTVIGNYIGTDADGMIALGNGGAGVKMSSSSAGNRIGGRLSGEGNVISGNTNYGIIIEGNGNQNNIIMGNIIGLNAAGNHSLGNMAGIYLADNCRNNVIGGSDINDANIISGNKQDGIAISSAHHNQVVRNRIGTDLNGQGIFPNSLYGISLMSGAAYNIVGPDNVICHNKGHGIEVSGAETLCNRITQNSIFNNDGKGILLYNGGNGGLEAPIITSVNPIEGTAPPLSTVEIFSDSLDEGRIFEDFVVTDASGFFSWSGNPAGPFITATAIDDSGNTSEFSANLPVSVDNEKMLDVPQQFSLTQNFPNPFNPSTQIKYNLPKTTYINLKIYNIQGQEIRTLIDEFQTAGIKSVVWDGLDNRGQQVHSGLYIYQIKTPTFSTSKKMVLVH